MSIQIPITQTDYKKLRKELLSNKEVICLDHETYIKTLLVGQQLAMEGKSVKCSNIKKGY